MEDIEKYIIEKTDNFGAKFYILDFGLKRQKTWNKLIKDFGFSVCKNKMFLENDGYYVNKSGRFDVLFITKKDEKI